MRVGFQYAFDITGGGSRPTGLGLRCRVGADRTVGKWTAKLCIVAPPDDWRPHNIIHMYNT